MNSCSPHPSCSNKQKEVTALQTWRTSQDFPSRPLPVQSGLVSVALSLRPPPQFFLQIIYFLQEKVIVAKIKSTLYKLKGKPSAYGTV